jgi:hypothetical protein
MSGEKDERIAAVRGEVESAIVGLSHHFHPDCKLTFVMRKPGDAECYMVVTDDDPGAIATLLSEHDARQDHERFLAECAADCHCCADCHPSVCAGVLAGGFCDDMCGCDCNEDQDDDWWDYEDEHWEGLE